MAVRWVAASSVCGGYLRDTGGEYDDFSASAEADLLARGLVERIDATPAPSAPVSKATKATPVASEEQ